VGADLGHPTQDVLGPERGAQLIDGVNPVLERQHGGARQDGRPQRRSAAGVSKVLTAKSTRSGLGPVAAGSSTAWV